MIVFFQNWTRRCVVFASLFVVSVLSQTVWAERPPAPELFPSQTLVYVRVRNTQELVNSFNETALGKMSREDKIRPLIADLYGSAAEAFTQVEDEVGVSLDEILKIPQGEIVFALLAMRTGPPVPVMLMDVGDQLASAEKLIASGEQALADQGVARSTETHSETELVLHTPADQDTAVVHFIKDNTVVITNNADVAKLMIDVWNGEMPTLPSATTEDEEGEAVEGPAFEPLIKNEKFVAIMRRCRGTKEDPAQFTFYVDPISLYRVASRGNAGAQVALALLPALGLDGLEALGGSVTFAGEDFDMVTHLHVKLSEPRTGIMEMLAMKADDTTPERWVPGDVGSYMTINWDANKTYTTLEGLYDTIRGEGQLAADVQENISDQIGLDFETDILANFGDRLTYISWYERPARINSQASLVGIRLNDPDEFAPTLEKLTDQYGDNLEKHTHGGVAYWTIELGDPAEAPAEQPPLTQQTTPCFAVLDDYLLVADRTSFLHKVILTNSNPSLSLNKELDFKLIAGKIKRQVGGAKPGMITFSRPEESFKMLYEMATGTDTREFLSGAAEDNPFFGALDGALDRNELPPFSVLAQYLAPGGGMLVSDETGFHYTGFVLKRK